MTERHDSSGSSQSQGVMHVVAPGHRNALVMCVDDDAGGRLLVKEVIEQIGCGFIGASSGTECLTLLQKVTPRIILLDVMMPNMDGFETCRHIRLRFPLMMARIIYMTALNSADDVTRALGTDADDYVIKPCRPNRLRERIQHWLREGLRVPCV